MCPDACLGFRKLVAMHVGRATVGTGGGGGRRGEAVLPGVRPRNVIVFMFLQKQRSSFLVLFEQPNERFETTEV